VQSFVLCVVMPMLLVLAPTLSPRPGLGPTRANLPAAWSVPSPPRPGFEDWLRFYLGLHSISESERRVVSTELKFPDGCRLGLQTSDKGLKSECGVTVASAWKTSPPVPGGGGGSNNRRVWHCSRRRAGNSSDSESWRGLSHGPRGTRTGSDSRYRCAVMAC
jgi:hypothetical protein